MASPRPSSPSRRYKIVDVLGDGSCFYRSVYQALEARKLVSRVVSKLSSKHNKETISTEDEFVEFARNVVSYTIATKADKNVISDVYAYLSTVSTRDYRAILESYPSWFTRAFKTMPPTENEFRIALSRELLVKSHWALELDIAIFHNLLWNNAKLHIYIFNDRVPKGFKFQKNTLYLLNRNEAHYNAVIVKDHDHSPSKPKPQPKSKPKTRKPRERICPPNKLLNPRTNRCVKTTSCKGYEIIARLVTGA